MYVPPRLPMFVSTYYDSGQGSKQTVAASLSRDTPTTCALEYSHSSACPMRCRPDLKKLFQQVLSLPPHNLICRNIHHPYHDLEPEPLRNECYLLDVECRDDAGRDRKVTWVDDSKVMEMT